jgi:hypothetical protein
MKIKLNKIFKIKKEISMPKTSLAWPVNFVRDWKIIVLFFAVGLVLLSLFSWKIYLSDKIAGGYLSSTLEQSTPITKTIDQKKLKNVLFILETKETDYLKTKFNTPKIVDPAL